MYLHPYHHEDLCLKRLTSQVINRLSSLINCEVKMNGLTSMNCMEAGR